MGQGLIVAILSILFYLSSLLGGTTEQTPQVFSPPVEQESFFVLGQNGEITAEQIVLREKPESESFPVGIGQQGQKATILAKQGEWYRVRLETNLDGWLPAYALTFSEPPARTTGKVVLGSYNTNSKILEQLATRSRQLTAVAPLGWKLNSYGELQAEFESGVMGRSLYFAGNQELETFANLTLATSPSRLLTNTYLQEQSIGQIIELVDNWGVKGVLLDVKFTPKTEQTELFSFIAKINAGLQEIGAKTMLALPWDANLDYQAAGNSTDYLILKNTADEYSQAPGPLQRIADLEEMLAIVTKQISPDKVILALTTYGLDWPKAGPPAKLSHKEILELAAAKGATIRWDAEGKVPYFQYDSGREVWFENRYSLKYKLDLIKQYNLAGLTLPDLGLEDPELWTLLEKEI